MPMYEFLAPDGSIVEHYYPMASAPRIGRQVTIKGVKHKRVPSKPRMQPNRQFPYTAHSLPPGDINAPHHDEENQPVFWNAKEEVEYASKTGMKLK